MGSALSPAHPEALCELEQSTIPFDLTADSYPSWVRKRKGREWVLNAKRKALHNEDRQMRDSTLTSPD